MKLSELFEQMENVDIAHKKINGNLLQLKKQYEWGITVRGFFHCQDNELTSLEGVPENVLGVFDCSDNKLLNLNHCPLSIGRSLIAKRNKINTVAFMPKYVKGDLDLSENKITSLEHIDKTLHHLEGKIILSGNPITKGFGSLLKIEKLEEVVYSGASQDIRLVIQKLNKYLMTNENQIFSSFEEEMHFYGLHDYL